MSRRKSSEQVDSEDDDFEEHSSNKIPKFEDIPDDEDDDDDEDEDSDHQDDDNDENEEKLDDSESEPEKQEAPVQRKSKGFGYDYMKKLGYIDGKGLGKLQNGIVDPVEASKQKGRRGFGFQPIILKEAIEKYDPKADDELILDEEINWLANHHHGTLTTKCLKSWTTYGPPKKSITTDSPFCDSNVIDGILQSKTVLDSLTEKDKDGGKRRSNPFEAIRNAIFLNRAAMKMANMDAILDWMFTEPKTKSGEKTVGPNKLLYFADVCAGPGGFSEYVLYRKRWRAKGFGFTLKMCNDFQLEKFIAGPPDTFETHYGERGDGDVYIPENIISFRDHVMKHTDDKGVHFMMADGGISIKENLSDQEIICKRLYLCQCLVALFIVRPGGHFVVKLFDIFTEFSVGLIYLMYRSFEEILILKPNTSRPANSERYLVCKWKREDCEDIANHLFEINKKLQTYNEKNKDVLELVPTDVLQNESIFFEYIYLSNTKLGKRQIHSLIKMAKFSENTELVDPKQQELRNECLKKWKIPLEARAEPKKSDPRSKWKELIGSFKLCEADCNTKENKLTSVETFRNLIKLSKNNWTGVVISEEESNSTCGFYLGLGKTHVQRYCAGQWTIENGLNFPANTILYGEKIKEFLGSGKGQTHISAFHIIDGLFLGGEDIRNLSFTERTERCTLFAKALSKERSVIRVKERYRLGNIQELWIRLDLRNLKSRWAPVLAIPLDEDRFCRAAGIMFIKDMRDPWSRHFSHNNGIFYLFCGKTNKSIYEGEVAQKRLSREVYLDFEKCFESRHMWWWDDGVIVHESQRFQPVQGKMHKDELMNMLEEIQ